MREKKFTKAPWHIDSSLDGTWVEGDVIPVAMIANGRTFAELTENEQADANLIAAAPELLEALEGFKMFMRENHREIKRAIGQKAKEDATILMRIARSAVAKAYGETP